MKDIAAIIGLTVGACLVVGVIGAWLLHLTYRRSLRHQLTLATVLPVLAVAVTVLINVRLMFLSSHDSTVVLLGLSTSLVLAIGMAYLVKRRILKAFGHVGAGLNQLIEDSAEVSARAAVRSAEPSPVVPAELADLLNELAVTRETLAGSRARERAAEQSRRELVSFMSHDLRTPLAGLRALVEGLEDDVIADVPRALGHLRATVSRMTGLVDDLFALSRVQGSPEDRPATLVSLTEVLTDVAFELTATATARAVQLDLAVPTHDRLPVQGAPDDLTRALTNLVANAIRHTDPGLTVRLIGQRADDGRVQVAVVDACGGIPEDSLARVFDTGWRGSPSRRGDDGGAGLGLAIAKGVVQSHDGQIAVRNVVGGCRFEVYLPPSTSAGPVRENAR